MQNPTIVQPNSPFRKQNHRVEYAKASAPWTRPEAEMEIHEPSSLFENRTEPGAFRIAGPTTTTAAENNEAHYSKQPLNLITMAQQQVTMMEEEEGIELDDSSSQKEQNALSSIVSIGSEVGDQGDWDTETATIGMLVQLRRSQRNLEVPTDDSSGMDSQQKQDEEDVISTDCNWSDTNYRKSKLSASVAAEEKVGAVIQEDHRPAYAPSVAPWTRPTGERTISAKLGENRTTPGAFRVSMHQDDLNGGDKRCDRLSVSDVMEMADDDDDDDVDNIANVEDLKVLPDMDEDDLEQQQQQQQQDEEDVVSTDCHWSNTNEAKSKLSASAAAEENGHSPCCAPSIAPWTRPTGERTISAELGENRTSPGAFRVPMHQDDWNGGGKRCDRLSISDVMEMADDDDVDNIAVEEKSSDGFCIVEVEDSN